jgi:hypothetical protein
LQFRRGPIVRSTLSKMPKVLSLIFSAACECQIMTGLRYAKCFPENSGAWPTSWVLSAWGRLMACGQGLLYHSVQSRRLSFRYSFLRLQTKHGKCIVFTSPGSVIVSSPPIPHQTTTGSSITSIASVNTCTADPPPVAEFCKPLQRPKISKVCKLRCGTLRVKLAISSIALIMPNSYHSTWSTSRYTGFDESCYAVAISYV